MYPRRSIFVAALALAACGDNTRAIEPGTPDGPRAPDAPSQPDAAPPLPVGSTLTFGVFETTDLHTNIRAYDYFKLAEDKSIGLERTATLIAQARAELPNSVLVDNGDTIQGTVLADYQALVAPVACSQPLAIYKVMNALGYDVAGIGNHEFNYGLGYLARVTHTAFDVTGVDTSAAAGCKGPAFPQVLSNVFSSKTDQPIFAPDALITRTVTVTTPDGGHRQATIKVGFVAFAPPPIVTWDKRWLDGVVYTKGVQETAPALVAGLRARGADLVIAIIHGGLDNKPYVPALENQAWYLAQVPGIDAVLMGHSHQIFPSATSTAPQFNLPMVDKVLGTVASVPAVMANFWGQHLGVMAMALRWDGTAWTHDPAATIVEARPIATTCKTGQPLACTTGTWATGAACPFATACTGLADKTKVYVDADPTIAPLVEAEHQGTITYVKTPIGTTSFELTTYLADVGDVSAIQIVNQAQAAYVASYVQQNLPQYAALPVLSVSAPFKSGFQGGNDFTDVAAGGIAINNAADLYLYANTVYAVKITGADLQAWLETAALRFAQIDPTRTTDQPLINPGFPGYNFDVVTDPNLSYEIDITQPLPAMGQPATGRIKNLKWKGQPIDPAQEFIVATNNYRASGGGSFPGLDGSKTIYASPDTNRDVLIAYIKAHPSLSRATNGAARSWRFTKVTTAGHVVFSSAPAALAASTAAGIMGIAQLAADDGSGKGLALYAIDLAE
jgi:2',3'-cyclic-nucleotide 2'-phosphodiesterase/3'-nucleotidase